MNDKKSFPLFESRNIEIIIGRSGRRIVEVGVLKVGFCLGWRDGEDGDGDEVGFISCLCGRVGER